MDEYKVKEQLEKMHTALNMAKEKIAEQDAVLQQLTSDPVHYATVVSIPESSAQKKLGKSVAKKLFRQRGTRVLLPEDHEYITQSDGLPGTIQEVIREGKNAVVNIRWDNGHINSYETDDLQLIPPRNTAVVVTLDGTIFGTAMPSAPPVTPGDIVVLSDETMQILEIANMEFGGEIAIYRQRLDDTFSEVDTQGYTRVVFNGKEPKKNHEKGDRVILDSSDNVIVKNLGKGEERFKFESASGIGWNDIGGLEAAKETMIEAIELPHQHADVFAYYKKRPTRGVLLYGPPGCGKTMLGKAAATSLSDIYGASDTGFLYIKGPEILDKYVGVAEGTVRSIFERARVHQKESGFPAVVFIDEAEAILSKRGSGISSDIEKTIVPMFLAEMDGLEDSGALIILATNRPDILDPAVVRDGRVDRKVRVTRPTPQAAEDIFKLNLEGVPVDGCTRPLLAHYGRQELFSTGRVLYDIQTDGGVQAFTLSDIISGGMIANVVDQATSIALHRDLAAKTQKKKSKTGVQKEDFLTAIDLIEKQNRSLGHQDALAEFVENTGHQIKSIQKRRVAA